MPYFNVRINPATANLLQELMSIYSQQRQIIVTKGTALTIAYEESRWVPLNHWDIIRDYQIPDDIPQHALAESAIKLKIPLGQNVMDGIDTMKKKLPAQLGASYIKPGIVVSYILKAAYIKYLLRDFTVTNPESGSNEEEAYTAWQDIVGDQPMSAVDVAFEKAQAELQALTGIDQAHFVAMSLKRLRDAIEKR